MSFSATFARNFHKFCSNTYLHGWHYITDCDRSTTSIAKKVIFGISIFISVATALFFQHWNTMVFLRETRIERIYKGSGK